MAIDSGSENLSLQPSKDGGLGLRRVESKIGWRMKAASAIAATAAAFGIGMKAEVPQKVASLGEGAVNVVRQAPERFQDLTQPPVNEIQKRAYLEFKNKEAAGNQMDFAKGINCWQGRRQY